MPALEKYHIEILLAQAYVFKILNVFTFLTLEPRLSPCVVLPCGPKQPLLGGSNRASLWLLSAPRGRIAENPALVSKPWHWHVMSSCSSATEPGPARNKLQAHGGLSLLQLGD